MRDLDVRTALDDNVGVADTYNDIVLQLNLA